MTGNARYLFGAQHIFGGQFLAAAIPVGHVLLRRLDSLRKMRLVALIGRGFKRLL